MRHRIAALSLLTFSVLALTASAQTPPMPAEFQVNTTTTDDQYGYGVVDGPERQLRRVLGELRPGRRAPTARSGARFNADGTAASGRRVPGQPVHDRRPGLSAYRRRSASATSSSPGRATGQDGDGSGIFARRFDHFGAATGNEFAGQHLHDGLSGLRPTWPRTAAANFVVVWNSTGQDGDGGGVFAQRFDNSATPVGLGVQGELLHDRRSAHTRSSRWTAAAISSSSWAGSGPTAANGIFARRFDSAGAAQGTEFQVNTGDRDRTIPRWPWTTAGDFVVAWEGAPPGGSALDVVARRYDSTGTALGPSSA